MMGLALPALVGMVMVGCGSDPGDPEEEQAAEVDAVEVEVVDDGLEGDSSHGFCKYVTYVFDVDSCLSSTWAKSYCSGLHGADWVCQNIDGCTDCGTCPYCYGHDQSYCANSTKVTCNAACYCSTTDPD